MDDLRGVHSIWCRGWIRSQLGAAAAGAWAAAGADCGCYWKKLWQNDNSASYIDFFFVSDIFWFRTFTRFVCAARRSVCLALSSFIYFNFFLFCVFFFVNCQNLGCVPVDWLRNVWRTDWLTVVTTTISPTALGLVVLDAGVVFSSSKLNRYFDCVQKFYHWNNFVCQHRQPICQGCGSSFESRSHERTAVRLIRR